MARNAFNTSEAQSNSAKEDFEDLVLAVPADLLSMVPGFLERREKDLADLRQFIAVGDFNGIKCIGHRLRGSGGGYGLPRISEIGQRMEAAALVSDAAQVRDCILELSSLTVFLKAKFKSNV